MFLVTYLFILPRKSTAFSSKAQQKRQKKPSFQHFFAFFCCREAKKRYICGQITQKVTLFISYKERKTIMRAFDFLATFIGGALVGAACGLLFAPEKGSDLREKIAEALRKRGIKLNRQEMSDLVDEIAEELQAAKAEE